MKAPSAKMSDESAYVLTKYHRLIRFLAFQTHQKFPDLCSTDELYSAGVVGFLEACHRFKKNKPAHFLAYTRLRVRGAMLDEVRGRIRGEVQLNESIQVDSLGHRPDRHLNQKELRHQLIQLLQELDEQEQLAISLYYFGDQALKAIADVLGVSVSRVSQIHNEAIRKLKRSFKGQWKEFQFKEIEGELK